MAADSGKVSVDDGHKSFTVSFVVPTKNLKPGMTVSHFLTGEQVLDAAGVCNADILNPTSVTVAAEGMPHAGIAVAHTCAGPVNPETGLREPLLLDTSSKVYHTDATTASTELYHAQGLGTTVHPRTLPVNPCASQLKDMKQVIEKRIMPHWRGYGESNVLAGLTKVDPKVEGASPHYLVTEHDLKTGEKSALWNLMEHNKKKGTLFGGAYSEANLSKMNYRNGGQVARKMSEEHVRDAVPALYKSLKVHSPFGKGLGVLVTNTGDEVSSVNTRVQLTVDRVPLHPEKGFIPREAESSDVSPLHVSSWSGGAPVPKSSTGEVLPSVLLESGTHQYVSKKVTASDLAKAIKFTAASDCEEFADLFDDAA